MENNKIKKSVKFQGDTLNFYGFIQVFVFTTNHHLKKVWDMIRKVSGKNKKSECVHIKSSNGNMCYSTKEISNALGENFQRNSSSSNYSQQLQDIKVEKERENLNFQSRNNEKYNLPFKLSELKNPLDNLTIQLQVRTIFIIKF